MRHHQIWDIYNEERQRLQAKLTLQIRSNMASLIGENNLSNTVDVLLVAADGRKLAAHICILRQRAPVFFQRYVEPTLDATPRDSIDESTSSNFSLNRKRIFEVAVGDVDSAGLAFFIRSVYTDEEVKQLGEVQFTDSTQSSPRNDNNLGGGHNNNSRDNKNNLKSDHLFFNSNNHQNIDQSYCSQQNNINNCKQQDFLQNTKQFVCYQNNEVSNSSSTDSLNDCSKDSVKSNLQSSNNQNKKLKTETKSLTTSLNFSRFQQPFQMTQQQQFRMSNSFPSPSDLKTIEEDRVGDCKLSNTKTPIMTSFRELAASSLSSSHCDSYDNEAKFNKINSPLKQNYNGAITSGNFLNDRRISAPDSPAHIRSSQSPLLFNKQNKCNNNNKIFPLFINWSSDPIIEDKLMSQSFPQNSNVLTNNYDSGNSTINSSSLNSSMVSSGYVTTNSLNMPNTLRNRTLNARRLSVTSLTSLMSIDIPPNHESATPIADRSAACQLARDLLQMYYDKNDTDVKIITEDGELFAHKCILSANSSFFQQQLKLNPNVVELKGFSKASVHFLLCFLYGGLTCLPPDEELDVWKVIALAIHLNLNELIEVAILHLRAYKCHFFHKPCASCVSAIFDALPQFYNIKCLNDLYQEALLWQGRHFSRIWKGRVFLHLHEQWQKECFNALLDEINEENVIDILLGCEKLQISLPRIKSQHAAQTVLQMVINIVEYCTEFLISSLNLLINSKSYSHHGLGLALNLSLLEEILPSLIHSLSAEIAIHTFINLRNLIVSIQESIATRSTHENYNTNANNKFYGSNLSLSASFNSDEWNPRFLNLNRRLFELTDRHLLHYAPLVMKCDAWQFLNQQEQNRITETGIFAEMQMPRAPPPRFSSLNRTYKRSVSVGFQLKNDIFNDKRAHSLERTKPGHLFTRLIEESPPASLEQISERNVATFSRSGSLKEKKSTSSYRNESLTHIIHQKTNEVFSKIPTKILQEKNLISVIEMESTSSNNFSNNKILEIDIKNLEKQNNEINQSSSESNFANNNSLNNNKKTNITDANIQNFNITKIPNTKHISRIQTRKFITSPKRQQLNNFNTVNSINKIATNKLHYNSSPTKKLNDDEMHLQRQTTRTVMTVQQNREAGIDPIKMGVPVATISLNQKSTSKQPKPQSVVRPMLKNAPLAVAGIGTVLFSKPLDSQNNENKNEQTKLLNKENKQAAQKLSTNKSSALPRLLSKDSKNLIKTETKQRYLQSTISSTRQNNLEYKKQNLKTKKNINQITSPTIQIAKPVKKIREKN